MCKGRVHCRAQYEHLWFRDLAQGDLGSALKVFKHLRLPPEHLCFACSGAQFRFRTNQFNYIFKLKYNDTDAQI